MVEKGLFQLTIPNLEYVYQKVLGENDLEPFRRANYTTLRLKNDPVMLEGVERDFATYFADVVMGLPENTREAAEAILAVLQHDELGPDDVEEFLERQTSLLPSAEGVPVQYYAMLFQHGAIEPTWANCLAFINSEAFTADILMSFLDRAEVRAVLLKDPMPGDSDARPLRQFIVNAAVLSDAAYREYVRALPRQFETFPEGLDPAKLDILIEEKKITFSVKSVEELPDGELRVRHVATNITEFLAKPDEFQLDDEFLEALLRCPIPVKDKRAIVALLDLPIAAGIPERAALVGQVLDTTDVNVANLDGSVARSLIANAKPIATQISLFNKLQPVLTDEDVRRVLSDLQRPFSEIRTGYSTPRLMSSPENLALVKWLADRKIISSWSEGGLFTDDIRVNLFRR
jgi:hypothetical protein